MVSEYLAHTILGAIWARREIRKFKESYTLLGKRSENWPQKAYRALRMCNGVDSNLPNMLETSRESETGRFGMLKVLSECVGMSLAGGRSEAVAVASEPPGRCIIGGRSEAVASEPRGERSGSERALRRTLIQPELAWN